MADAMSVLPAEFPRRDRAFPLNGLMPTSAMAAMAKFLLDGQSGNIIVNVKDGQVMGLRLEQIVRVTAK